MCKMRKSGVSVGERMNESGEEVKYGESIVQGSIFKQIESF
jgi:hypothetical protein